MPQLIHTDQMAGGLQPSYIRFSYSLVFIEARKEVSCRSKNSVFDCIVAMLDRGHDAFVPGLTELRWTPADILISYTVSQTKLHYSLNGCSYRFAKCNSILKFTPLSLACEYINSKQPLGCVRRGGELVLVAIYNAKL